VVAAVGSADLAVAIVNEMSATVSAQIFDGYWRITSERSEDKELALTGP